MKVKLLIVLGLLLGIGYFVVVTMTAQAQEALANCYVEANRNIEGIMKDYSPTDPNARNICSSAGTEAKLMKQCVNNVYEKYGKTESAIGLRLLYLGKKDPVPEAIKKHNENCAQFPDSVVK